MGIGDNDNTLELTAKVKPNKTNVYTNYRKYLKELSNQSDCIDNPEELLYALNPINENNERDKNIMQRIKAYLTKYL